MATSTDGPLFPQLSVRYEEWEKEGDRWASSAWNVRWCLANRTGIEMRALPLHWKIFLATLVGFFAFWTYGSVHFARDPGSLLFYDPKRAYERKYSIVREEEVLEFRRRSLNANNGGGGVHRRDHGKGVAKTCAVIVSVDRRVGESDVHPLEVCSSCSARLQDLKAFPSTRFDRRTCLLPCDEADKTIRFRQRSSLPSPD